LQWQRVPSRILYGAIEAANYGAAPADVFAAQRRRRWAAVRSRTPGGRRHNQGLADGMKRMRKLKADY
jgi:hypothetical protein